jgi:hypothetical protein
MRKYKRKKRKCQTVCHHRRQTSPRQAIRTSNPVIQSAEKPPQIGFPTANPGKQENSIAAPPPSPLPILHESKVAVASLAS